MTQTFDVVVVGARCAGSALATFLARAGLRVCVLDRAKFPSDTPSTHGIQPTGVAVLERLGVLGRIDAPRIERARFAFDDARVAFDGIGEITGHPFMSVRRITLDAALIDAAGAAGAEVRTGVAVTGLVERDGRVAGVSTSAGKIHAALVVGADGARSTVARLVGAPAYHETRAGRVFAWSYFEGVPMDRPQLWLGGIGETGFLASPTDGDLFMAAVALSAEQHEVLRADREGCFDAALRGWPELEACVGGATRAGPVRVMSRLDGFFRRSAGPGWALAGDAGHFKDPSPGQGIADALRQAERLAAGVGRAVEHGPGAIDRAVADWWTWRDRDAWEMYWFAHDLGAAGRPPLVVQAVQERLAAEPALLEGFLRLLNHELAPSRVFTPGLLAATVVRALRARGAPRRLLLAETRDLLATQVRRRAAGRRPAATLA